uniref:Uncharacterized protein n=1 Tax=Avena sativa TaxID=4498 RepID=A0ACD5YMK8_AVESA
MKPADEELGKGGGGDRPCPRRPGDADGFIRGESVSEKGKKAGEELGTPGNSPEEVAAATIVKGRRARRRIARAKKAEQCAGKIDVMRAVVAAGLAKRKAREAARIAKAKAEEAEEAWGTAKAKAVEAEEAAKMAEAAAEEAARATEAADEARRLKDKETEWAQCEEELVASNFRPFWNRHFANMHGGISFHETTSIPAKCYTYPTPDDEHYTRTMETMQIVSVKVTAIKEPLLWPLQVFGIVAVRDVLDHKRNIMFQRPRNNCQHISEDDPYLALTGPSRAVAVSMKPTYIEVSLKVKGGTANSDDKDLSELLVNYRSGCVLYGVYPSRLSTLELKHDIIMHSVEATICIKVTGGSWPDGFRGVTSSADDLKVKLLDFGHDGLPVDDGGMIKLTRSVVSVGLEEMLKVSAMACPMNKEQVCESSEASFKPAKAGISLSRVELKSGSCSMEVSVAWSLFYPW